MAIARLRTLGGLALEAEDRVLGSATAQRRPLGLLAVLAAMGGRPLGRERLQCLLWPEADAERARRVLAQVLYALRRDIGDPTAIRGINELSLNPSLVTADVIEFEQAVRDGELERAVVLYGGPFLDGVHLTDAPEFERWAAAERARLARLVHEVLERLAKAAMSHGDAEVAAGWWRRLADLDPLNGRVAVGLMAALAASGDSAGALQHARIHEALLREELGAPPDPEVTAFARRLRTQLSVPAGAQAGTTEALGPPMDRSVWDPASESHPDENEQHQRPHVATPTKGGAAEQRASNEVPRLANSPRSDVFVPASVSERREGPAVTRVVAVGIGAALACAAVIVAFALEKRALPLDQTLVVVVPFDAPGPDLQIWREGLVDVLARNLDGAGPVRAVSPTVVVRRWRGHADRDEVAEFARQLGAGAAVYGGLVPAGPDSVQAAVTVLETASGRAVLEVRHRESVARMDRLTDSLTLTIARGLAAVGSLGANERASLRAPTSVDALRAFLRGEQFYRRSAWDSAVAYYEQAAALDPSFALAHRRLGLVASWRLLQSDSLVAAHLIRAGALNRGLGLRDSLLIAADSQGAAAVVVSDEIRAWPYVRRLFATLAEAARRYPNDPEVWFAVGEARYHFGFGPGVGVPERETLAAFDRAIVLDSAFAPSYIHAVELGFNLGGATLGMRYARSYLALNPTEPAHRGVRLVEFLVATPHAVGRETAPVLDTLPASALVSARTILRRWPDTAETAVGLSRVLAAGRASEYPLFADTGFMRRRLAEQLAFRGHLREASAVLGDRDTPLRAELAYLGALPPNEARTTFARWLSAGGLPIARLALPWWAAQRDTVSIKKFARQSASRALGRADPADRVAAGYDTAAALAHLALARSDTAAALARFSALPDTLCAACYLHRLVRARLLLARRRYTEARGTLEEPLVAFLTPIEVIYAADRAEAAARLGDRAGARAACAFVRAAWRRVQSSEWRSAASACGVD